MRMICFAFVAILAAAGIACNHAVERHASSHLITQPEVVEVHSGVPERAIYPEPPTADRIKSDLHGKPVARIGNSVRTFTKDELTCINVLNVRSNSKYFNADISLCADAKVEERHGLLGMRKKTVQEQIEGVFTVYYEMVDNRWVFRAIQVKEATRTTRSID